MAKSSSSQKPTQVPPEGAQSEITSSSYTTPMENAAKASVSNTALASSPSQDPPAGTKPEAAGGAAGTIWNKDAIINASWSINEDKNSWVSIANIGWIKLSNASNSGNIALSMLASYAKLMGSIVYYRQEDDGMIHEFYV
jgi:hypothetical protein